MIQVYKCTWRGQRLMGWQSDDGMTYKTDWRPRGRAVSWKMDKTGQVYSLFQNMSSLIGWVTPDGAVWDEYAQPYGTWDPYRGSFSSRVRQGFLPGLVFRVRSDGAVFGRGLLGRGTRQVGFVQGSSDVRLMGALALLLLRDYD